jgi:hypothetical protein
MRSETGQFVAYRTDRNIIKKERESEKLIRREVSCREDDNFIEKNAKKKNENTGKREK